MFDLKGMTALVTGASGGIGSSIAYALARQGARIALSGSNGDKLRVFREQLMDEVGGDHVEITCNLSDIHPPPRQFPVINSRCRV